MTGEHEGDGWSGRTWGCVAGVALVLLPMLIRVQTPLELNPRWDGDPLTQDAAVIGLTPSLSLIGDMVTLAGALLLFLCGPRRGTRAAAPALCVALGAWGCLWWTGVGGFNYGLPVQSVGVFVASTAPRNTPQPGHTALFDFFFNETAPITPEDANAPAITVTKVGQGTVTATPAGPTYTCGQRVQLRAAAATGWRFQNWSVDLNGVNPIQTLVVNRRHNVTATFIQPTSFDIFLPMAIR